MPHASTPDAQSLAPQRPLPTSNTLRLRVRYSECDPMGVAHHAAYAPWFEIGRTEILRDAGVSYAALERAGIFVVIARLEINYKRPIHYDDLLELHTQILGGSRVKIRHAYRITLAQDGGHAPQGATPRAQGELLSTAETVLVRVDAAGRVQPLPDWMVPANPV